MKQLLVALALTSAAILTLRCPVHADEPQLSRPSVAGRRSGTAVMVHRGAVDWAVENTLAAFEAAFLTGGDGIEIDIRATADGTLVMMHDEWIDRVLDAYGPVGDYTYEELLLVDYRDPYGVTRDAERVPTLEETLKLCRRYAGLIHLDIKEPGHDAEILAMLARMDLLENVVTVNPYHSEQITADERIRTLASQGSVIHGANDYDAGAINERLAMPRKGTLLVDDARCAAALLKKSPPLGIKLSPLPLLRRCEQTAAQLWAAASSPAASGRSRRQSLARLLLHYPREAKTELSQRLSHLPSQLQADWLWAVGRQSARSGHCDPRCREFVLATLVRHDDESTLEMAAEAAGAARLADAVKRLTAILDEYPAPADEFALDDSTGRRDATRIRLRAAAAKALGRIGQPHPDAVRALRRALVERGLHVDGSYHALDGAEAAKALAVLDSVASVELLKQAALRIDERLTSVESREELPWWLRQSKAWWDFRLKVESIHALGRIGTPAAHEALRSLLQQPSAEAERAWRELHWDAACALTGGRRQLDGEQLTVLLNHPTAAVRRTAAVHLLRQQRPECENLAKEFVPWFVSGR